MTWPGSATGGRSRPRHWSAEDAQRAAEYLAETDVVVWTPRRQSGRPLTFRPLPDFAAVKDEPDDLDAAIDAAAGAIAPRVVSSGRKAEEETAVLREALRYYAKSGASDLAGFVDLLDELPEDITSLRNAECHRGDPGPAASGGADQRPAVRGGGRAGGSGAIEERRQAFSAIGSLTPLRAEAIAIEQLAKGTRDAKTREVAAELLGTIAEGPDAREALEAAAKEDGALGQAAKSAMASFDTRAKLAESQPEPG